LKSAPLEVIQYLVEQHPASITATGNGAWMPLHRACQQHSSIELIRFLVEQHPDSIKEKDDSGALPLHLACGNFEAPFAIIQYLVEQYPDSVKVKQTKTAAFLCTLHARWAHHFN
jgi:ankyrin repeat protein